MSANTATLEFAGSIRALAAGAEVMPGGVGSEFRQGISPTPLVFKRGDGPYLVDVDGNRLIDYYLGMGPMILGHTPAPVIDAVTHQLRGGILFAGQSDVEYEAARLVRDMVPCASRVRFNSSGSESIQAALRVARAATGRTLVVKFEGHYHGWFDNVLWSVSPLPGAAGATPPFAAVPGSVGMDPAGGDSLVVLPWGDLETARARILAGDIAAVIMEPAMCNTSVIPPAPGYLEGVREACDASGTVLVFDEVITGFRLGPGGAQGRLGVTPDLAVFGKALASGFPVSALAGREDLMELLTGGTVVQAGTYNGGAVSMAATVACLRTLRDPGSYDAIEASGTMLMEGIRGQLARRRVRAVVQGWPSVFHVALGTVGPLRDYQTARTADRAAYVALSTAMLRRGVRALERGVWFLSTAHGPEVVTETLDIFGDALDEVLAARPELLLGGHA